jgi:hypothetical protein
VNKVAAHDKWLCIGCRWTTKIEFVDVRSTNRPSYRCPKCRTKMLWAGTAFRPPRKGDDEGWLVVEQLLGSGFRYVTTSRHRRRVPRTLEELDAWRKKIEVPLGWAAECQVRMPRGASSSGVRCGQHALFDGQEVLAWHGGKWREGRIDISPRGRVVQLIKPHRTIALSTGLRLRLRIASVRSQKE